MELSRVGMGLERSALYLSISFIHWQLIAIIRTTLGLSKIDVQRNSRIYEG